MLYDLHPFPKKNTGKVTEYLYSVIIMVRFILTLQAASKTANIIINKVNFHISRPKEVEEGL